MHLKYFELKLNKKRKIEETSGRIKKIQRKFQQHTLQQ